AGQTVTRDFSLRNLGNIAVTGSIASPAGFTLGHMGSILPSNYNYSLAPGESKIFSLSYDATEPTQINETIVITSNDLSNPVQTIAISLQVVDNDDPSANPVITKLVGNYPNPFNPETSIRFSLKEAGNVSLRIYNLRGQLVRTLVNGSYQSGNHTVVWNGRDNNGNSVSSGVYMYRMESPGYNKTMRMMLVK
ncbi:MAG TPA: FlgD immunoglobulin-like domain containing protein, partial [Candidatus Cloacimonadota bacterium]|nr:FlgD immunoglobulin-like domain containing protein [Candidatus Cloacimonadota bacterium]